MPPCFDRWCKRFDDIWTHQAQKRGFRNYIGGLLGESERKNLSQMADNAVGVIYHRLHHFLTEAPWDAQAINERRLSVMNQCSQTRISRGFTLIVDDSGHRKSGNYYSRGGTAPLLRHYRRFGQQCLSVLSSGWTKIGMYSSLIKLLWALFGVDFCLNPDSRLALSVYQKHYILPSWAFNHPLCPLQFPLLPRLHVKDLKYQGNPQHL